MDKIKSGYIIKPSCKIRNKDKIPAHDLRRRVLLKNFLRHQIGVEPHSLFDLREKKQQDKAPKKSCGKRVALKSLPSTTVSHSQDSSKIVSVLNDVQVNRVSSSVPETDLQCSVVSSSQSAEMEQVESTSCSVEQNDENCLNHATETSHSTLASLPKFDKSTTTKKSKSSKSDARIAKMKNLNGPHVWKSKLGLNTIRKKFKIFMDICSRKRSLNTSKKIRISYVRPVAVKNDKVLVVPADSKTSENLIIPKASKSDDVPSKLESYSSSSSSIVQPNEAEEAQKQESIQTEDKILRKELDYYISLYDSKTSCARKRKICISKTLSADMSSSTKSIENSENIMNNKICSHRKSRLKGKNVKKMFKRSMFVKAFYKENRKWYERRRYRRLKVYYIPACGDDSLTVEQHIKHKCIPSHVSFLPYTKYMKASEYFLYLNDDEDISTTSLDLENETNLSA